MPDPCTHDLVLHKIEKSDLSPLTARPAWVVRVVWDPEVPTMNLEELVVRAGTADFQFDLRFPFL